AGADNLPGANDGILPGDGTNNENPPQDPNDQNGDGTESEDDPVVVSKEFDINLKGKLDVPDGFEADVSQKIKKIELSGEESVMNDLKDFEIDLAKIEIKEEEGKIEFLVKDLDLPKDIELVDAEKDDIVVLITVAEEPKEESKEEPKEEPKKEEVKKTDATVPKADDPKTDEKKNDSKDSSGGDGDPNNPI
ncbi:MAG: hypothetical protein V1814_00085, partial [Candidatus Moraniibacteriota bacterium]